MVTIFPIILYIYGAIIIIGGIAGYAKSRSTVSLVTGIIAGAAAIVGGYILTGGNLAGLRIGQGIAAVLMAFFMMRFITTRTFIPAGIIGTLSLVVLLLLLFLR